MSKKRPTFRLTPERLRTSLCLFGGLHVTDPKPEVTATARGTAPLAIRAKRAA